MTCVAISGPQCRLLDQPAEYGTLRVLDLEGPILDELAAGGWVCEHRGAVALTGAGAYHAGAARKAGLLG